MSLSPVRLGVICDFVEENWPSMDLIGDMLVAQLGAGTGMEFEAKRIRPPMSRRFTLAGHASQKLAFDAERFFNRFWDYPRFLRRYREAFDVFHIVDHSYAQLILELPASRTVVTCHDVETFRCLIEPELEQRSAVFRAMVGRTLRGLQLSALVVCPSVATRDALLAHNLIPMERLRVVPLGTHPSCSAHPDPAADREAALLLGESRPDVPDLLHVGSTVLRKRIDFLLQIFAQVKKQFPRTRLVRVGGAFTHAQESLVDRLKLRESIVVLPHLERPVLAAVYRRAAMVLLPSEREGFGLPVVEAMACGTPVIASDLPCLREIGGDYTIYASAADTNVWSESIVMMMNEWRNDPQRWQNRRESVLAHASRFTWNRYARRMVQIYREVIGGRECSVVGDCAS